MSVKDVSMATENDHFGKFIFLSRFLYGLKQSDRKLLHCSISIWK